MLPPIQEPLLANEARMVFCAAVDRNGYLPVHNRKYSLPQRPGEKAWNTANSRNRRIFDDRAGLASARNVRPYLIQVYPRDMGNGVTFWCARLMHRSGCSASIGAAFAPPIRFERMVAPPKRCRRLVPAAPQPTFQIDQRHRPLVVVRAVESAVVERLDPGFFGAAHSPCLA